MVRGRISITATEVDASRLHAREGAYLALHCDRVDLSASELLRGSIFTSSPPIEANSARNTPSTAEYRLGSTPQAATAAATGFRNDLAGELYPTLRWTTAGSHWLMASTSFESVPDALSNTPAVCGIGLQ